MKRSILCEKQNLSISNLSTAEVLEHSNLFVCRCCNKNNENSHKNVQLVFPCGCLQPIHVKCLTQQMKQIRRGLIEQQGNIKHYVCNKCKEDIKFDLQTNIRCRNKSQIVQYCFQHCCLTTFLFVAFGIMIGLFLLLGFIIQDNNLFTNSVMMSAVVIAISIMASVLFFIILYFVISEIALINQENIKLMRPGKQKRRKSSKLKTETSNIQ